MIKRHLDGKLVESQSFTKLAIGINRHQLVTRHPGVIFFSAAFSTADSLF
jgi:hypothetical protein